jgi:WS/DGAT/MGAT family acyltransferase
MGAAEHMSGVDRAWLLMDHPTNPMIVVGLLVLESSLERTQLRDLVAARFLAFHRFRCFPLADALGASWVESAQFDIEDHVFCAALPAPAGQCELETLLGELASTPFNPEKPRWSFHLVQSYRGGSAIIVRIHHCYADGMALVQVLLSLCGDSSATQPSPSTASASVSSEGLASLIPSSISDALRGGANLLESGIHYLFHPAETTAVAREALGFAGELAHIATLSDDPVTRLKRPLSGARRAAWASTLSLEEVRTLGHLLGCTVNDVLISTLAGALGRYLAREGDDITGLTIRATVPVNLRPAGDTSALGNRFGLVFVELPIGIRHPLERLCAVHDAMQKLKGSSQAIATLGLLSVVGTLPAAVEAPAIAIFSAKASLVASNLPGPHEPLLFAGAPISQLLFWVPQAGSIGTGVSMFTYRGQVQLGVMADRQLISHPADLIAEIGAEFERLVFLVLLGAGSLLN